jgi:RNA polymerase sigma-70 factor, ECF subfamily
MKTSAAPATASGDTPATDVGQASDLASQLPQLRQRLLRQARFAVYDAALAEDLVQDTLLAVFEQASSHQGQASLTTWATAILKNKVADWYRSPNRKRFVQQADEPEDTELSDGLDALYDATGHYVEAVPKWQQPENNLEQRQMMTMLELCAARLPKQTGRVFMMREWLGFETPEICTRLEITADNCRTTLHRARMGMRECMQIKWLGKKEAV